MKAKRMFALALMLAAVVASTVAVSSQAPVPAEPRSTHAALKDRRLWFTDTGGTGVPVVFLHAASGSSLMWERQIPAFRAAGYRCITYDRVGWGQSVLDPGAEPGAAADDLEALRAFLRVDRFHLIGSAAGGIVAFDYALSFPDRVGALVVANSVGGVQDDAYLALGRRLRPSPQFDALPVEIRELGPSYRAADVEGTAQWIALAQRSRAATPLPSAQRSRNRVTFERLEAIRSPSLLITGGADLYMPPPVLQMFAARIRGADTLVVPEAGHSVYWEAAGMFNAAVLQFLARH